MLGADCDQHWRNSGPVPGIGRSESDATGLEHSQEALGSRGSAPRGHPCAGRGWAAHGRGDVGDRGDRAGSEHAERQRRADLPHYLQSPDGHFHVVMESNGNLVETIAGGRTLWSTGTSKYPGARAVMQVNGNLVIYDPTDTAVWSSNSPTGAARGSSLQNDGNLVIYGNTAASWSDAEPGQQDDQGGRAEARLEPVFQGARGLPADDAGRRQPRAVRRLGHRAVVNQDLRPCRRLRLDADRRQPRRLRQDRARPVVKRHQRPPRLPPGDARRRQRRHHRPRRHGHVAQQDLPQGVRRVAGPQGTRAGDLSRPPTARAAGDDDDHDDGPGGHGAGAGADPDAQAAHADSCGSG